MRRNEAIPNPCGTEVPEEWWGHFLNKREGYAVYNGPRALPPQRVVVGRADFGVAMPSEEWRSSQRSGGATRGGLTSATKTEPAPRRKNKPTLHLSPLGF